MATTELLSEGINLMLLGMGIVFSFLAILVLAMSGMSSIAKRLGKEEMVTASGIQGTSPDGELIAVISAAVQRFRSSR